MSGAKILWVDDEIDLLRIQILFLEEKGHKVTTAYNGDDAIDIIKEEEFDIIFLDENMPGISGIDVLDQIKRIKPHVPIIMITKNDEEAIMEEAIGLKINDYLIKPVNPKQIILAIKKNVENKKLISEKITSQYQTKFNTISIDINNANTVETWVDIYKRLTYWELELERSQVDTMNEILKMQKEEANKNFGKFIKENYLSWFEEGNTEKPLMPFNFIKEKVIPLLDKKEKVFVIVIDNLRYDQWKLLEPIIRQHLDVEKDELSFSMLPTATQYARNALFAGLTPYEISKRHPEYWLNDEEDGGKNMHEEDLLKKLFERYRRNVKFSYDKILNNKAGEKLNDNLANRLQNQLSVVVYNFVDIMSHARTEMKIIKELANDEAAYRELTLTWFKHSPLLELFKRLSEQNVTTFITTDHGTIPVHNPVKVVGDKNTSTNLRYKMGRNLSYNKKKVFEITKPEKAGLPSSNISSSYIFCYANDFFAYPNNFNYYVRYYKDTLQHGGLSMEELIIPCITLKQKKK